MRLTTAALTLLLAAWPGAAAGQTHAPARRPRSRADGRLGLPCTRILERSAADWVAYFQRNAPSAAGEGSEIGRATAAYGHCYDARTDRLAASLARARRGPSLAARRNFIAFAAALRDFTAKVLATADAPARADQSAYAALFEKQFRYAFYQSYAQPAVKPASSPPAPASATKQPEQKSASGSAGPRPEEKLDPLTAAKNHFGELLGEFPDDQMHELHAAFGKVLLLRPPGIAMEQSIYGYANFLLAPASETPPPAPPF